MNFKKRDLARRYALTEGRHCVYGVMHGYYIHVRYTPVGNPRCLVTVVTDVSEKQKKLEKYLEASKQKLNITNFGVVKIGLMVCPKFTREVFARAEDIIGKIAAFLAKEGFAGADVCPYCGQPLEGKGILATESDIPFAVHEACFARALAGARRKDAEKAALPDKKALGALGGVLGALFGGAVCVLTYAWWGFGALGAAVGALFSYYLYRKFGGKSTAFAVAFCGAASLLFSLAALAFGVYMDGRAAGGFAQALSSAFAGGKGTAVLCADLACTLLLAGGGTAYNAASCRRERRTAADGMRRLEG